MTQLFEYIWYKSPFLGYLLWPLSWVFRLLAQQRKLSLINRRAPDFSVPVIIIGNITVGGTGKTPLVIAVIEYLQAQGYQPGVISRGYGGNAEYPMQLNAQTTAAESGDEPLLIAQACNCPVVVSPNRYQACEYLLKNNSVDVVISDDGLQHYALPRDIEIVVFDGQRGLGNGLCLPAGPLREPVKRLSSVDFVVVNGEAKTGFSLQYQNIQHAMQLTTQELQPLTSQVKPESKPALGDTLHAVAAIGNPQRFFNTLNALDYKSVNHSFADHYQYRQNDLDFDDDKTVVMTEKDAIKCKSFTHLDRHWYLPVKATLPESFWTQLSEKLSDRLNRV